VRLRQRVKCGEFGRQFRIPAARIKGMISADGLRIIAFGFDSLCSLTPCRATSFRFAITFPRPVFHRS
jgi:hypothetical protein